MRLALVFGNKSESIKPKLQSIKDNLDIDCFSTISSFIDFAIKRDYAYNRVLILSSTVNDFLLQELKQYWDMSVKSASFVLLCRKDADVAIARKFLGTFNTPSVCAMMVTSTTLTTVAEAALCSTSDLNEKYGLKDSYVVDTEDSAVVITDSKKGNELTVEAEQQVQTVQSEEVQEVVKPVKKEKPARDKKKFGFFGKKEKCKVESFDNVTKKETQNESSHTTTEDTYDTEQIDTRSSMSEFDGSVEENSNSFNGYTADFDDNESEQESINSTFSEVELETATPLVSNDFETNFEETSQEIEECGVQDNTDYSPDPLVAQSTKNDFEPEGEVITEVPLPYVMPTEQRVRTPKPVAEVDEIDEDLGGLDIAKEESKYREITEAPKVVKETVVKEVIRNIGTPVNMLSSIEVGKNPTIFVVTGDRGTGVTSTALSIASYFMRKTSVLYFDCDTVTHGLLSYISYDDFRKYTETQQRGVSMCCDSKEFDRYICKFDDNLDVLSSGYDCDVTDEELQRTAGVVDEKFGDYGVVVVDCPVSKLHCIKELILTGYVLTCVDASKRGYMNMLQSLESSPLPVKQKKLIVSKGTMLLVRYAKDLDIKKLVGYINGIFEPDAVNWLDCRSVAFSGSVDDRFLNFVLTRQTGR